MRQTCHAVCTLDQFQDNFLRRNRNCCKVGTRQLNSPQVCQTTSEDLKFVENHKVKYFTLTHFMH